MGELMGYYLRVNELVEKGYGYNQAAEIAMKQYPNLKKSYEDKRKTEETKKEWY